MNFLPGTIQTTIQDARFTLRQLRRAPAFSLTVIVTLALALGATAALAGVLRATLLNPLPYAHASELVRIEDRAITGPKALGGFISVLRTGDLIAAAPNSRPLFSSLGYYYADDSTLTVDGHEPFRVPAIGVSGGFFPTLAAQPLLGRTITPADDKPNGPQVLVISRRLWQNAFGADPAIIGRSVHLGPAQATIIGVMPDTFTFPAGVEMWHPGGIFPSSFGGYRGEGSRYLFTIARLQPGTTLGETTAQATQLSTRLAHDFPATDAKWAFNLIPLRDSLFGDYRKALTLLSIAVGLVLLLAAINVAGLQLSRNARRQPEFALRTALGITQARLTRQLLTESTLLVLAGCAAGLALAAALLRVLATRLPPELVQAQTPRIDLPVLFTALGVALVVGLFTGALPAWQYTRPSATTSRTVGESVRTRTFGRSFTVLQIALSLVLLGISSSVLRSVYALVNTPLGFQPTQLETFTVDLPWGIYGAQPLQIYRTVEQQFLTIPGVTSAGAVTALPLTGVYSFRNTFDIAGLPPTPQHDTVVAEGRQVSPGYLATMQIPLLGGRNFSAHDSDPKVPAVLLVNHTFADRYFPGQSPIGKHLIGAVGTAGARADAGEIVGIVGDVHGNAESLAAAVQPEIFFVDTGNWPHMQFAIRTTQPLSTHNATLEQQVSRIVRQASPLASAGHFATLSSTLDGNLAQPRLNAGLLTSFAALSLLLVIVGVYGLVAFDVAQRTRELGLRIALGSTRNGVLTLLLNETARILIAGLVLGLITSFAASRLLVSLLAGTTTQSITLTLATTILLAAAVLAATYIPARKASLLDPMEALKTT